MEISEHHFASTQPIKSLPGQPGDMPGDMPGDISGVELSVADKRLHQWLYSAPAGQAALLWRLLHLRAVLAFWMPTLAGVAVAWHSGGVDPLTVTLVLVGNFCMILGINLLNDHWDYQYALKSNDVKFIPELFATAYHLLAAGQISSAQLRRLGYGSLLVSALAPIGLYWLVGWPVIFFYAVTLLFLYTYTTPPTRYSYRGWAIGELGVLLGYGFFPLVGSYFIVSQSISWLPLLVSLPFGLLAVLSVFTHNLLHYRRDWLMRKRTLVVSLGPLRTFDVSAMLTILVYAAFLAIASLAHLPLSILVTLAALPLALRTFSQLRSEQPPLEVVFRLHLTMLHVTLWTGLLFCVALLADKAFS
ncbi:MAG: prenyltransferase [Caldilinea sp. CFX5]|nr:prenyltransferase [Caldilinea sp. CFX5]